MPRSATRKNGLPSGGHDRRCAPHLVQQVDGRAQAHALRQEVAGLALGGGAPGGGGRSGEVLLPQLLVVREAAGGEDDTAPGPDGGLPAVAADPHADDPAVLLQQFADRGVQPQLAALLSQRQPHPGDQGLAEREQLAAGEQRAHGAEADLERGAPAGPGAADHVEVAEVEGGDGEAVGGESGAAHGGALLGGEAVEVEDPGFDGAALRQAARLLGKVVAVAGGVDEAHLGAVVELPHHPRAVGEVGVLAVAAHPVPDGGVEVGAGLRPGVAEAGRGQVEVAGGPDRAAGEGAGAPVAPGLLHHQHAEAAQPGGDRGGHPGCARADHDHVVALVPMGRHCASRRGW